MLAVSIVAASYKKMRRRHSDAPSNILYYSLQQATLSVGSQFTCRQYVEYVKEQEIRISMDGKGRALDNIYIERFWRTIKYQHIHLFPAENGISLYIGIKEWLIKYHYKSHQGIGRNKPSALYLNAA